MTVARCPVRDEQMPDRDPGRGGRRARYCSGACKAKAYRARRQAGGSPVPAEPPLPAAARHARAVEIRQRAGELIGTLADAASGQQSLFASPGAGRSVRPVELARTLHQLIAELAALAASAAVTKRPTERQAPAGVPQTLSLFDDLAATRVARR